MSTIEEHEAAALGAFKENVAAIAKVELDRLEVERDELEKALMSVRAALKSVRAVLSASLPTDEKQRKPKKQKAASAHGGFVPSEERLAAFSKWLGSLNETTEITSAAVRKKFPNWADSYVSMMLKWARENGLLRKSGQSGMTVLYRRLG